MRAANVPLHIDVVVSAIGLRIVSAFITSLSTRDSFGLRAGTSPPGSGYLKIAGFSGGSLWFVQVVPFW